MLINKLRTPLGITARAPTARLDQQVYSTCPRHAEQAETKESAQLPYSRVVLAATTPDRCAYGKPNLVAGSRPINALQHQIEIETEFQLTDDYYRGRIAVQCDEVTAANLALHLKSQVREKAFDRKVERGFQGSRVLQCVNRRQRDVPAN
jgi:hypothetical protein